MSYRMKVFSGWYLQEAADLANEFFRNNAINLHTCQVVTDEEGMVSALIVYSTPEYEIIADPIAEMATVDAMRGL
jgi:hypothetical protein